MYKEWLTSMKNATITLRLSEEEKEKLKSMAAARDIPVSQLVRELCKKIFDEKE